MVIDIICCLIADSIIVVFLTIWLVVAANYLLCWPTVLIGWLI